MGVTKLSQKKNYSRYFIILQEDEKGYSLSADKIVSGYLKSELKNDKCKISYYVQNLKKQSIPYHMVLICNKKDVKKIIKIGKMNIDDYGRADVSYEYPANNIAGTGVAMDKVSGAAIVKFLDSNVISIMSGFTSKQIPDWRNFEVVENSLRSTTEEEIAAKQEPEVVENNEDENTGTKYNYEYEEAKAELKKEAKEDTAEDVPSSKNDDEAEYQTKEKSIFDKYEEVIENNKQLEDQKSIEIANDKKLEVNNTQPEVDDKKVEISNTQIEVNNTHKIQQNESQNRNYTDKLDNRDQILNENISVKEEVQENDNRLKQSTPKFFRQLVDTFEGIDGIYGNIKRCDWYKVKVDSIKDMYDLSDINKYKIIYHPMVTYYDYIKKYGYYMMGYKHDKMGQIKYLVYGVPGTKNKYDQPLNGRSGFVTWVPLSRNQEYPDSIGCWLMFYDFRTSTVIIPVKKR
jgi:hypothetical protein